MSLLAALLAGVLLQTAEPITITLERTACFGTCPVYVVEITGDGQVRFTGKDFVRVTGPSSASIPRELVASLVAEFDRIDYWHLRDNYEYIVQADGSVTAVTDLPTTITSIRIGARYKRVTDYIGAPPALKSLERRIDEIAGTQQWVSMTPAVVEAHEREGWSAAGSEGARWLRDAVIHDDLATARSLLDAHADPNGDATPPLALARSAAMVRLLGAAGADVNRLTSWGEPLLMSAVRTRHADIVAAMLAIGARAGASNARTGQTVLQLALTIAATPPPPPFPGDPPEPHDEQQIVAMLRAAGAK
jgi:hypothetical protein